MNSRACVKVGNDMSDSFSVKVGLCQESVNCHLTCFNTYWYMDGIVRGINAGLLGRGLSLLSEDGREWNVD